MSVVVVGLNHRTVPLDVLERMTVDGDRLPKALYDLRTRPHLREAVVLSTCNRTEIYAVAERYHGALDDVRSFLTDLSGINLEEFSDHLYAYHDEVAVAHLFKVAAGLDSAVVGESEILGQVRAAYQRAGEEDAAGSELARLFAAAIGAGRRARNETSIGRGTASVSQAAVAMAADRLGGSLDGKRILVLGAGEIGAGMAVALAATGGLGEMLVVNRTRSRAVQLAKRTNGRVVDFGELATAIVDVDVVLTSTGALDTVVTADDLDAVMDARGGRPLLVVDVAVPRDVDPAAASIDGVTLLDMDDLRAFADATLEDRKREIPRVQSIIAEEAERFLLAQSAREVTPTIVALRERAEELRLAEVDRLAGGRSLSPEERARIDAATKAVVNKLLHEPTVQLKREAATARGERLAEALRVLFDL